MEDTALYHAPPAYSYPTNGLGAAIQLDQMANCQKQGGTYFEGTCYSNQVSYNLLGKYRNYTLAVGGAAAVAAVWYFFLRNKKS